MELGGFGGGSSPSQLKPSLILPGFREMPCARGMLGDLVQALWAALPSTAWTVLLQTTAALVYANWVLCTGHSRDALVGFGSLQHQHDQRNRNQPQIPPMGMALRSLMDLGWLPGVPAWGAAAPGLAPTRGL